MRRGSFTVWMLACTRRSTSCSTAGRGRHDGGVSDDRGWWGMPPPPYPPPPYPAPPYAAPPYPPQQYPTPGYGYGWAPPPLPKGGSDRTGPLPLHPMSLSDILDGAFKLFRANFRTILTIVAILAVPFHIIGSVLDPKPRWGPGFFSQLYLP